MKPPVPEAVRLPLPESFLETLQVCPLFEKTRPITVARAPGRLDVMGGIADYSGALVLQLPLAEATFAAVQRSDDPVLTVTSGAASPRTFDIHLSSLTGDGRAISSAEARKLFEGEERHWASYVAGAFVVLARERGASFSGGAKILITSEVPEGKGVASSAALEVAAMQAIAATYGIPIEPREIALLCQTVENHVAGAPCGIMDQMTAVCGEANSLLALLCQPAELQPFVPVPKELSFWGLDSGERHAVSGSDYASVRAGAFMGRRILSNITAANHRWNGYLANVSVEEFEREFRGRLPDKLSGREFLDRYSSTHDTVTTVEPGRTYRVRQPTAHPVYEHHRVQQFRKLLQHVGNEEQWTALGQLMYDSHASYSACGLGSPGTDRIVNLVREEGPENGLYGARITGGGSGGTVAILGRSDAGPAVERIARACEHAAGYRPYVFSGSSHGAAHSGFLTVNLT